MPTGKKNPRPSDFTKKQLDTLETWPGGYVDVLWNDETAIEFGQRLKRDEQLLVRSVEKSAV